MKLYCLKMKIHDDKEDMVDDNQNQQIVVFRPDYRKRKLSFDTNIQQNENKSSEPSNIEGSLSEVDDNVHKVITKKNKTNSNDKRYNLRTNIKSNYRNGALPYNKDSVNAIDKCEYNKYNLRTSNIILNANIIVKDTDIRSEKLTINNISLSTALKSKENDKWINAMKKEYNNLMMHNTWEIKPKEIISRYDRKRIVKTMWVLAIKRDGTYKARLVARGDRQSDSTYSETYASTLSYESLRLILAEAALEDYEIQFMDISNTYVNANIDTDIYIYNYQLKHHS